MKNFEATTKNTAKTIRLRAGLHQDTLAARANLSRMVVVRTEQFISTNMPESLAMELSILSKTDKMNGAVPGFSPNIIRDIYLSERQDQISQFSDFVRNNPELKAYVLSALSYARTWRTVISRGAPVNPLKLFREELFASLELPLSAIKFCQYTGMHPAALSLIESRRKPTDASGAVSLLRIYRDVFDLGDLRIPVMSLKATPAAAATPRGERVLDVLQRLQDDYYMYVTHKTLSEIINE